MIQIHSALVLLALAGPALAQTPADLPFCAKVNLAPPKAANSHVPVAGDYPVLAKMLHEEGNTVLEIVIAPDGSVASAKVLQSSGSLRLDEASADIVKARWRYEPVLDATATPVSCRHKVMMNWHLDEPQFFVPQQVPPNIPLNFMVMKPEDYPAEARARGEEGSVGFVVIVLEDGKTKTVMMLQSSGFADLDAASQTIVQQRLAVSNGATFDGKPVRSAVFVVMIWTLHPPKPPVPALKPN
jgi:TonB family protein